MLHEFRAPLGNILFFIKLIMEMFPPEFANRAYAEKNYNLIFAQVQLMQTFVDDMLDLN